MSFQSISNLNGAIASLAGWEQKMPCKFFEIKMSKFRKTMKQKGLISNSFSKSAAASAQVFERAIQKETRAFQQLKASVDPAYAAQRRYEAAVRQVEAAVRMGAVSQKDANAVLAQAKAAHLGAATAATTRAARGRGPPRSVARGRACRARQPPGCSTTPSP